MRLAALAQWHVSAPETGEAGRAAAAARTGTVRCVVGAHRGGGAWRRGSAAAAALLLIGFWRAFRSDELCRLQVEHIQVRPGEGMQFFLPWSKGDRDNQGQTYQAPALARLCPVQAYSDWISVAGIACGPVFRSIDRWGHLSEQALHPHSVIPLLRAVLQGAGLPADLYSSHSLRRGFATWATRSGWDQKALMDYVGWRDAKPALRYVEAVVHFPGQQLGESLTMTSTLLRST
nr:site-specific integrase [Pseudomonas boanensis]